MDLASFDALFVNFKHRAFRLETLPRYEMNDEQELFDAYLKGKPLPPEGAFAGWADFLKEAARKAKAVQLVRILPSAPTPYVRFEIDWGYLYYSEVGEDIRILVSDAPSAVFGQLPHGDFWLFDDSVVVDMAYAADGHFIGPREVTNGSAVSSFIKASEVAISESVTLRDYLANQRRG